MKTFKVDPDVVIRAGQIVRINGDLYRVSHSSMIDRDSEKFALHVYEVLDLHLEEIKEEEDEATKI